MERSRGLLYREEIEEKMLMTAGDIFARWSSRVRLFINGENLGGRWKGATSTAAFESCSKGVEDQE